MNGGAANTTGSNVSQHRNDLSLNDSLSPELQERLADILDAYLVSLEQGVPLDLERIKAEHPELAGPLSEYLEGLAILQNEGAELQLGRTKSAFQTAEHSQPVAKQLGDFELVREVGRGGMGVVYEARQLSLDRLVALKVLPFAAMLDEKQIARFENEARAAAQLHHPNIVPIHGVGSDRGVHFYAMQLIRGQSLQQVIRELRASDSADGVAAENDASETPTGYSRTVVDMGIELRCDETRSVTAEFDSTAVLKADHEPVDSEASTELGNAEIRSSTYVNSIIRLIVQAADGLHAAHQFGVIHRDVKPSNLMVDQTGKLWITDFGLARFQTDQSVTQSGEILGTLHYMSPEQASGRNALVDERSDVYSLGVTLYELLTLKRPFEGAAQHEVIQLIEQGHFRRPRLINSGIPSDLENVLLKAMSVDREDRYDNASELADDLRLFLEGKPTRAKRPKFIQQVSKWTRRHQRAVVVSGTVMMMAVAGLTASNFLLSQQKRETETALERSQANLLLAQGAVEEFVEDVDRLLEPRAGSQHVRERLLQRSLQYYEAIIVQAGDSNQLQNDIAIAKTKMAAISGMQGDWQEALDGFESAAAIFAAQLHDDPTVRVDYVRCISNIGSMHRRLNDPSLAVAAYKKAVTLGREAENFGGQIAIATVEAHNNLGLLYAESGKRENAVGAYERGLELLGTNVPAANGSLDATQEANRLRVQSSLHNNLWEVCRGVDEENSRFHIEQAIQLRKQLLNHYKNSEHISLLASSYSNQASSYIENGQFGLASDALRQAADLQRTLVYEEPLMSSCRNDLAVTLNNLGHLQVRQDQPLDAEETFRESISMLKSLVVASPHNSYYRSHLGGAHNNLGLVQKDIGRLDDAQREFQEGIKQLQWALKQAPANVKLRDSLSRSYFNYGHLLREVGNGYRAARIAMRRRELWPGDAKQLHSVATELAMAYAKTSERHRPDVEQKAVDTMKQAQRAGWRPTNVDADLAIQTFSANPEMKLIVNAFTSEEGKTVDAK